MNDDKLKTYLRERLGDYAHPADDGKLESVGRELFLAQNKRTAPLLLAAGAAAAILALIFFVPWNDGEVAGPVLSKSAPPQDAVAEPAPAAATEYVQPRAETNVRVAQRMSETVETGMTIDSTSKKETPAPHDGAAGNDTVETAVDNNAADYAAVRNKPDMGAAYDAPVGLQPQRMPRKGGRTSVLIAANGISGASSANTTDAPSDNGLYDNSLTNAVDDLGYTGTDGLGTPVFHHPVTFTLAVRRSFPSRLGIETGLSYTFLKTTYEGNANNIKLHYLGLPLRAVYTFNPGRRVVLYASAGGTLEVLVGGKLHTEKGDRRLSNPRLQWSAGASAGVQFNLGKRVGIFAEPGLTHWFDDGGDIPTIRKEKPLNIGIQFGLRLDIN